MATKKSQYFRCFVEGNTISDGREITGAMIDEIVSTFNVDTYAPRINIEHIAGYSPEPPFNGYGTVTAVKAQIDDITIDGKTEKRKALYAQVDGNAQLVKLAADDQKPFPSVELTPSYAGIGKIGLVGLAFTDTPASIATQALKFSHSAPGHIFAFGTDPVQFAFEGDAEDPVARTATIAATVAAVFSRLGFKPAASEPVAPVAPPAPANDNAALYAAMSEAVTAGITAATAPIKAELAALTTRLETTEQPGFHRQPATGAPTNAQYATDC
jgi:hypothetical protein